MKLPDGRLIGRLDHIFKQMYNIKESQIIQEKLDELTIKIVKRPNYSSFDERDLINSFQERMGSGIKLNFEYVNEIPREKNGKFRAVISKMK